jgi:hypothetical protein
MAISEKVDELKSLLTSSTPLSSIVQANFLPDKEIVKNILKIRSPNLSKSDIETMVEGGEKNQLFNYVSQLDSLTGQLGNIGGLSAVQNLTGQLGNLQNITGQLGNIQNLTGQLGSLTAIGGQLNSVGNLPSQSGDLSNLGQSALGVPGSTSGNILQQYENFKSVPGPETIYSVLNKAKTAVDSQKFPLPQVAGIYDEAQEMKSRVLVCITMLSNFQQSLIQELIRVAIQLATTLSGIAIMVAPMSFNVPAAISMLMLFISALENICKVILSCLPFLDCLKLLDFVIDNVPSNPVVKGLEIALTFLISIYKFCSILTRLIQKLFGSMNKITKDCEKQKKKFKRKKRRKIRQLREILDDPKFGPYERLDNDTLEKPFFVSEDTQEEDGVLGLKINGKFTSLEDKVQGLSEDDQDEAFDLADEIFSFDQRIKIICNLEVPEDPNADVDFSRTDLDEDVFEIIRDIRKITDGIESGGERYVYDAELPDGRIIRDLDIEDIEELQERFNVIFKSNENLKNQ